MNQDIYKQEIIDWDQNAEFYKYDNFSPYQEKITRKEIYDFYQISKDDKVLEVGGGIIKANDNTIIVDFSPKTIEICKKFNKAEKCVLASAHQLPFANNSFDVVVCNGVLHHLKVQGIYQDSISEFYRVLKTGGKLCIFDRANNFFPRIFFKLRQPLKRIYKPKSTCSTTNETEFLDKDIEKIKAGGFEIIRRKFIINVFYQAVIIFANILHYLFGHRVSFVWQKLTWPFALIIEKLLLFKILCAEQVIVFKKHDANIPASTCVESRRANAY